jgi:hypothetical protein
MGWVHCHQAERLPFANPSWGSLSSHDLISLSFWGNVSLFPSLSHSKTNKLFAVVNFGYRCLVSDARVTGRSNANTCA